MPCGSIKEIFNGMTGFYILLTAHTLADQEVWEEGLSSQEMERFWPR